jgi:hypothetical protein
MNNDQLIAQARSRFDHQTARRILKEKYLSRMIFAHSGGLWRAGPELLTLLQTNNSEESLVILDLYDNPVQISVRELDTLTRQIWQEQMNAWLMEFQILNQQR